MADSPLARQPYASHSKTDNNSHSKHPLEKQTSYVRASIDSQLNDEVQRRRESELRKHSFFQLKVNWMRGQGLVAMDKSGE